MTSEFAVARMLVFAAPTGGTILNGTPIYIAEPDRPAGYLEKASVSYGINEVGEMDFTLNNKTEVDAYTGIGPFSPGGAKEFDDFGVVAYWVGDIAEGGFTYAKLLFAGFFRTPRFFSEEWENKFQGIAYAPSYLLTLQQVPCYLSGGMFAGSKTVREIICGSDLLAGPGANAQGVTVRGLMWQASQTSNLEIYVNENWSGDFPSNSVLPGVPLAADLDIMGYEFTDFRASQGSTMFQELRNLCDQAGLVMWVALNTDTNHLNLLIRRRQVQTDVAYNIWAEKAMLNNELRLSREEKLDSTLDQVQVYGDPVFGISGEAGIAVSPRFIIPLIDESIKSDEIADLMAQVEFARRTGDLYEGSFSVDPIVNTPGGVDYLLAPNYVTKINDPENGYVDAGVVAGRIVWEFDPNAMQSKLTMQVEPDLGVWKGDRVFERRRYELQRMVVAAKDAGNPASTKCSYIFKETKKLQAAIEAYLNGTPANNFIDGTPVGQPWPSQ